MNKLVAILALASAASAAAIERNVGGGCQNPGAHMCGAMIQSSITTVPYPGGGSRVGGNFAQIVNGNCDQLDEQDMKPRGGGHGFHGTFNAYGIPVDISASQMGVDAIKGVTLTFEGKTYYQSQCRGGSHGFDPAVKYVQCNFPC